MNLEFITVQEEQEKREEGIERNLQEPAGVPLSIQLTINELELKQRKQHLKGFQGIVPGGHSPTARVENS